MKKSRIWIIWLLLMLMTIAYLTKILLDSDDKTVFMPGDLTSGHHQIGVQCSACHTDSFADVAEMQKACESCHGDQRIKPFDSHPKSKFTDPRNADRLEKIDALHCVTCHVEHKPEITQKTGLTQPVDFCVHCHQDIAEDRPSHAGMGFETCASAGCHNYHNNRSLYTDFLVKHMHEPDLLDKKTVPEREFSSVLEEIPTYPHDRFPVKPLSLDDLSATEKTHANNEIVHEWLSSSHAGAGVTCNACHLAVTDAESAKETIWTDKPGREACAQCHDVEVKHFTQGKHGMRLAQGLSPMTPAMARLPMKKESMDTELDCNTCHRSHAYKTDKAAVETCLQCHDDKHSQAYLDSPHYALWKKEQAGELAPGSGVSCATCHMPRMAIDVSDWLRRTVVQHNQNATLVPNEKMIRPVCMNCHGLGFSIDAMADKALIEKNFKGSPSLHIESIDMAERDHQRHQQETTESEDVQE